jgi:hypothetical protein
MLIKGKAPFTAKTPSELRILTNTQPVEMPDSSKTWQKASDDVKDLIR